VSTGPTNIDARSLPVARKKSKAPVPPPAVPVGLVGGVTHADCLVRLPEIPDGSVALAFCDPPFNIKYKYASHDDDMVPAEYLNWCCRWLAEVARVLTPTGSFWLAISDEYASELKVLAEGRFHLVSGEDLDLDPVTRPGPRLHMKHHVFWYFTFGMNSSRKLTRSHTHLLHFTKARSKYAWYPDDPAVRVPSARALVYNDKRANPKGRLPDDTWILRPQELPDAFQAAGHDTWHDNRVCGTYKEKQPTPNQMPEAILERIIRLSTAPGDLVLDPFAGSGTTPAVAKRLGRPCIAFEKDPGYAATANARVAAVVPPQAPPSSTESSHADPDPSG
jgi:DNA modification methylase